MVLVGNCESVVLSLNRVSWHIEDASHYTIIPQITIKGTLNHVKGIDTYNACDMWRFSSSYTIVAPESHNERPHGPFSIADIDNESGGLSSALALKGFLLCWLVHIFLVQLSLSSVGPTPCFKWILRSIELWNNLLHFQLMWSCTSIFSISATMGMASWIKLLFKDQWDC